ncbi:hypothetical protein GCM10010411_06710 [Actinomadura fulvescens]|uniref:Restriction endonuclease type IV Mrr domain-containing protein n=2 Tax=Actinomadura fulvescens TaxID=46160 RepID=A0ABN3PB01_9ACTN
MRDADDELPAFRVLTSFSFCRACRHWEHLEWRTETYDARALLYDSYHIQLTQSKEREFETVAPEGTLAEIGQWFRRLPKLYNSVEPRYLEKLVARVFAASGEYCEVVHVGRPDDGGVDVVLVEGEDTKILVQVKRREHPESVESVSTIRNLLGTLVLESSNRGIVVSTADHFSYRARQAIGRAAKSGFIVRLVDRRAFDLLLAGNIPKAPWSAVLAKMEAERREWFGEPDAGIEFEPGPLRSKWHGDSPPIPFDPNQIPLFDI